MSKTYTYFGGVPPNLTDIFFESMPSTETPIQSSSTSIPSSLEVFRVQYAAMHGYVSAFVCIFGIVANLANIVVLTRKNMITSTNLILTWLAVTDSLKMADYLMFAIEFYILKDSNLPYLAVRNIHSVRFLLFHASFALVCHNIAIWLTISLATFRFLYIWFPNRGMVWCSIERTKIMVAIVYIIVIVICIPNYMMNFIGPLPTPANFTGNTTEEIWTVHMVKEGNALHTINFYIQAIMIKLVPCVMLSILTFLLIYAMHKAYKKRLALMNQGKKEESDRHHEHNRTTGMLLAIVVLFLITELPQGILSLLIIFIPELQNTVYNQIGDVLDIVALCNNAINFVLYCSMSKQFRDTFVRIFCKCCPIGKPNLSRLKLITNNKNGHTNYETNSKATYV
ncbi:G-protein coupled receptor dmsr-1-like [Mytilus edulis]|uniref:G-protein coupled receptor dmsr-1-like n=1 Tax=Mytilus edulis TaxID=6550 RepID=UPI0039F08B7F